MWLTTLFCSRRGKSSGRMAGVVELNMNRLLHRGRALNLVVFQLLYSEGDFVCE